MNRFAANGLILQLKLSARRRAQHLAAFVELYDRMHEIFSDEHGVPDPALVGRATTASLDLVRVCSLPRTNWTFEDGVILPYARFERDLTAPPTFCVAPPLLPLWPRWLQSLLNVATLTCRSWTYSRLIGVRAHGSAWRRTLRAFRAPPGQAWPIPDDWEELDDLLIELNRLNQVMADGRARASDPIEEFFASLSRLSLTTPIASPDVEGSIVQAVASRPDLFTSSEWPHTTAALQRVAQVAQVVGILTMASAAAELSGALANFAATTASLPNLIRVLDHLNAYVHPRDGQERSSTDVLYSILSLLGSTGHHMAVAEPSSFRRRRLLHRLTKGSLEWYVFHHLVLGDPFGVIVRRLVDYKLKPPALLELDRIESAIQMLAMYSDPVSGGKVDWPVVATEAEFEAALDLAQSWLTHRAVRPVAWNAMDRSHVLILIAILYSIYENLSRRLSDTYLDDEVELAP